MASCCRSPLENLKLVVANIIPQDSSQEVVGLAEHVKWANWYDVVSEYFRCNLTFEKDRLPALTRLAEQAQRLRQGRYLAGLWEDLLVANLG